MEGLDAIANYQEVGNQLQELVDLYNKARRVCEGVETIYLGLRI